MFLKLNQLDHEIAYYEMEMAKRKIVFDNCISIGFFILNYAKLRNLEMDEYFRQSIDQNRYQYLLADTDSIYFAIDDENLDNVIKPEKKAEYNKLVYDSCHMDRVDPEQGYFLTRKCCEKHKKLDSRILGLFKEEHSSKESIGLCSKTYVCCSKEVVSYQGAMSSTIMKAQHLKNKYTGIHKTYRSVNSIAQINKKGRMGAVKWQLKISSKGVSKKYLHNIVYKYRNVLKQRKSGAGVNRGFRMIENKMYTYEQMKTGYSYLYCKRVVHQNGISTEPLSIVLRPIEKPLTEFDIQDDGECEVNPVEVM